MKKKLIIGMLLGATLVAQASDSKKLPWNERSMTDASNRLNGYIARMDLFDGSKLLGDIFDSFDELTKNVSGKIADQMSETITAFAEIFIRQVEEALNDANAQRGSKNLAMLQSYLDTTGKFLAKMYDMTGVKPNWITSEVALRGTTFGSEYRKEYFLVNENNEKLDNEKNDGRAWYFYSEPTNKPGILRIFGIGYTDKRSWKKYFFEKAKYPALLATVGFGAYKGAQTESGQNFIKFVKTSDAYRKYIDESGVEQWVQDTATTASNSKVMSKAKEFMGVVVDGVTGATKSVLGYFSEKDKKAIESIESQQDNNNNQINNSENKKNEIIASIPVDENGSPTLTAKDEKKIEFFDKKIDEAMQKNEQLESKKENIIVNNASPVPTDDPEFKAVVKQSTLVSKTTGVSSETRVPKERRTFRRRNQASTENTNVKPAIERGIGTSGVISSPRGSQPFVYQREYMQPDQSGYRPQAKPQARGPFGTSGVVTRQQEPMPQEIRQPVRVLSTPEELENSLRQRRIDERMKRRNRGW